MSAAPSIDLSAVPESQRCCSCRRLRERDALQDTNRRLEHLIAELNQAVHGKRSEKLNDDERQLAFEDLETAVAEAETPQDAEAAPRTPPRRAARRNRWHLPESLPRVQRMIEPSCLLCPCGKMHRMGEDRTERLDIMPAQLRVIVTVHLKYACRRCAEGVTQAPAPAHLIEGGLPTGGCLGACADEPSMPITCHCIAKARSSAARASSFTAARWPIGSAPPPSTSARWSIG